MNKLNVGILITVLLCGCSAKKSLNPEERVAYENEVNAWHAKHIEELKAPDGWLNLAGLYWLEPGLNSFGSSEKNNVIFPEGKIAGQAGYFIVEGNSISIRVNKGVTITSQDELVTEQIIFHPDSAKPVVLNSGTLRWNVIKRESKLGIRLRDLESETLKTFTGVDRYPVDPVWRVDAHFTKYDSTHTIPITNVLGQTTQQPSPGALVFTLNDKEYKLDVLDGGDEEYFVIFADATTGTETYHGGRFLYVKKKAGNEPVVVDFNKAYNPPCVFTPFATCPLPPVQNVLPLEIRAGEKDYKELLVSNVNSGTK